LGPGTGALTGLGQTPTEKTPRTFDIDPSGHFLFAAGESSGRLAAYRINQETGSLARIATYDVGQKPWWVLAVRLPGN
jgi:6-phosphogluconolactonase